MSEPHTAMLNVLCVHLYIPSGTVYPIPYSGMFHISLADIVKILYTSPILIYRNHMRVNMPIWTSLQRKRELRAAESPDAKEIRLQQDLVSRLYFYH